MTYKSRGRSLLEVMVAAVFVGFLTGFVCVLCVGNYYRAKRAMERQKQKRLARLSEGGGNGLVDSPKSSNTSGSQNLSNNESSERQHLLAPASRQRRMNNTNNNNFNDNASTTDSLLFQVDDRQAANLLGV